MPNFINPQSIEKIKKIIKIPTYVILIFFSLLGLVFFWAGGVSPLITNLRLNLSGLHTQGTVVGAEKPSIPIIEFVAFDKRVIRFKPNITADSAIFNQGGKVDLIYFGDNPHEAVINDKMYLWILPGFQMLIGGIFLIVSFLKFRQINAPLENINGKNRKFDKKKLRDYSIVTYFIFAVGGCIFLYAVGSAFLHQYQMLQADFIAKKIPAVKIDFSLPEWYGLVLMALFSLIFVGLGAGNIIFKLVRSWQGRILKQTGRKIVTMVCRIEQTNTAVNKVYGRKIVTKEVKSDNAFYFYSDTYFIRNLENYVLKGDLVDVYVDPLNPNKYFVDVKNLTPAGGSLK